MRSIAFIGGLLIDGSGTEPVENSLVLVENKKITYAGVMKEIEENYEIIDISGKTIMPGLIDSHLGIRACDTKDNSSCCSS